MNDSKYIKRCPIGCEAKTRDTDIFLPEGCLKMCENCHHLFSQCSEQIFEKTMEEFNDPRGTWPTANTTASLVRNTKKVIRKLKDLSGLGADRIRLLDVGCSNGSFIFQANQLGVRCEGVEPAEAAARAGQQAGLTVHHGFLEDVRLPAESYDVITLFEVIEHLREPLGLLQECHRVLKKNGIMVIKTANTESWTVNKLKGQWHYFNLHKHGGHISFFNQKSMALLAGQAGFTVEQLLTHSVSLYVPEKTSYLASRFLKMAAELLNLPAKISQNGQEMVVYLRKSQE